MKLSTENKSTIDVLIPTCAAAYIGMQQYKLNRNDYRQMLIMSIMTFVIVWIITSQITKTILNATADKTRAKDKTEIISRYGLAPEDFEKCERIASDIYSAFHSSSWSEDETKAISAISKCGTIEHVKAVCEIYLANYGKSVKSDFESYVHFWDGFYSIPKFIRDNWF